MKGCLLTIKIQMNAEKLLTYTGKHKLLTRTHPHFGAYLSVCRGVCSHCHTHPHVGTPRGPRLSLHSFPRWPHWEETPRWNHMSVLRLGSHAVASLAGGHGRAPSPPLPPTKAHLRHFYNSKVPT